MRRPSPLPQPAVPSAERDARAAARRPRDEVSDEAAVADLVADAPLDRGAVDRSAAGRGAVDRGAVTDAADGTDLDITAPIIPLVDRAGRAAVDEQFIPTRSADADEPGSRSSGLGSSDTGGDDPAEVGLREVWRASRARRKALRAEIRRFTVRQRRRRAVWLGAAASVVLLALATIGAAYSPLFAVERIVVVGAQQLDADEIVSALDGQLGTPMPLVDESAIKAELVSFPLIETYALEARPPHELVLRIVERTPIGLIETRAGFTLVDAAGVALSTSATPSPGTPVLSVTGGVKSDAFAAVGQVMRSLPADIRAQVTAVAASSPDDVTLTLGGTNTAVVWGSAERSAEKALTLQRIMVTHPPASVTAYDVSSPEAVGVR